MNGEEHVYAQDNFRRKVDSVILSVHSSNNTLLYLRLYSEEPVVFNRESKSREHFDDLFATKCLVNG